MSFIGQSLAASWDLLLDSAVYVLFGMLVAGLLKAFLSPQAVARHLGSGRFWPVVKAALLGVPIPLCSCGVLPAAASLRSQGANRGAVTSFLISTPESGVDSIAITYALMDPVMTVARPLAAMTTGVVAGVLENLGGRRGRVEGLKPDLSCPLDGCCDGVDCDPAVHARHHRPGEKLGFGLRYAFGELWADLAGWFLLGILLAGVITALVPDSFFSQYLGGGITSMLAMLAVGIPLYMCATSSTPIAAALVLKGLSPGAALVFLLAGPATNAASLTVLVRVLGKRATAIYLASIAVCAVLFGLALDQVYAAWGLSARAVAGQAAELLPGWLRWGGALALLAMSVMPLWRMVAGWLGRGGEHHHHHELPQADGADPAGCAGST